MTNEEWRSWDDASNGIGMAARWDGSFYYPTKIPDLIGIKDRKFFDHTAMHRHRGIEDLMRYAAQVMSADSPHFGPYELELPKIFEILKRELRLAVSSKDQRCRCS